MDAIFWFFFSVLVFSFVGYGVLLVLIGFLTKNESKKSYANGYDVSFLVCAHNESAVIKEKIENINLQTNDKHKVEIIIVSDGSTDNTAELARSVADNVTVLEAKDHIGKLEALNWGLAECKGEIIVFSDANSLFPEATLNELVSHFNDESVGGVCGQIVVSSEKQGWIGKAESIYWRYDQALKIAETKVGGAVSAQGSVYAIRRELTSPVLEGCADDFVLSVGVVTKGKRLVFEPNAMTYEHVTNKVYKEFDRRVRSTEMGWRGLMLFKELLNPFKYGWYSLQLFSHKLLRRLNPVLLIGLLLSNALLLDEHWFYQAFLACQVVFYAIALLTMLFPFLRKVPGFNIPTFFVMGHAAMAMGIINVCRGKKVSKWKPVRDDA
ncbi:glycosyltransferase family 2 protein [Neptuniibacter sp. QD72_48]|uniref:glycosyltransferase family 2 protein n=1 Tax=unclassified Neptuniibacter TaxID=2630693 RepID=UPI0039F556BD